MDLGNFGIAANQWVTLTQRAEVVATNEMANGIETTHYRFGKEELAETELASLAEMGEIDSVQGDVWIANEGGFVVKIELVVLGKNLEV